MNCIKVKWKISYIVSEKYKFQFDISKISEKYYQSRNIINSFRIIYFKKKIGTVWELQEQKKSSNTIYKAILKTIINTNLIYTREFIITLLDLIQFDAIFKK